MYLRLNNRVTFLLSSITAKYYLLFLLLINPHFNVAFSEESFAQWRYSTRKGDTLIHIAKRYLNDPADWRALQLLNKIKNPYLMLPGRIVRVPLNLLKQSPAPAVIVLVSGVANVKWLDNTVQAAMVGSKISAGTQLITGENSKINLKFADGSIVTLESNTTLNLDALSTYGGGGMVDTKLRLQQGKVEVMANPTHQQSNMQIFTPTAVAAVRGTEFRVSIDGADIRQETLNGNVELSAAGDSVSVVKGYGSLSENGRAPLPPVLLLKAPDTSNLPNKFEALPVSFELPAQDKAVGFEAQISSDAQFKTILASNVKLANNPVKDAINTNQLIFEDLQDGEYYLKVRAKDKKGLEGYDATHTFSLNARPFAPKLESPKVNEIVRDAKPTLVWSKVMDAKTYLLELARDNEFKDMVSRFEVNKIDLTIENPLAPGQYFWRLASIDGVDKGPYADTSNFTYKVKPDEPDVSQLKINVLQNRVFVTTIEPPSGLTYKVILNNDFNAQKKVWMAQGLDGKFNFLLKEFGQQTLSLSLVEAGGVSGPESVVEFIELPQ